MRLAVLMLSALVCNAQDSGDATSLLSRVVNAARATNAWLVEGNSTVENGSGGDPECVSSGRMVIKMERVPSQPVKDPPNLVRACPFDLDRLLSHIDPGPAEESEAYVRLIYEQRRSDLSSKRNG